MGRASKSASSVAAGVGTAVGIPKGPSHAKQRALRKQIAQLERTDCRVQVWNRDRRCCRRCGCWVGIKEAHVHEVVFRSHGGDPLDPKQCLTLCPHCHLMVVHGQGKAGVMEDVEIVDPEKGTAGPVRFVARRQK